AKSVHRAAIQIKQAIRAGGRSVRVVPNKAPELSSAQVIHNRLLTANGWELLLLKDGAKTIIAQTVKVQDIEAYTRRDLERPFRDPRVGQLPPKLAQIIINLAAGLLPPEATESICAVGPDQPIPSPYFQGSLLLDPFCGSGVILQEAAIMGYNSIGSDVDRRMISYARSNIEWLIRLPDSPYHSQVKVNFELGDAKNHHWTGALSMVASETNLGRPLAGPSSSAAINRQKQECHDLILAFLNNLAGQIKAGSRICLAIPAWPTSGGFVRLPLLDSKGGIDYNLVSFRSGEPLIYYRPNQLVARELIVLTRK
ncbi:MAG: TRM11 family SAM-dependent methyltransferase, partial [Candidatus Saccharimonadales bacterium]